MQGPRAHILHRDGEARRARLIRSFSPLLPRCRGFARKVRNGQLFCCSISLTSPGAQRNLHSGLVQSETLCLAVGRAGRGDALAAGRLREMGIVPDPRLRRVGLSLSQINEKG
jgi:hypothetical protein